MEERREDSPAGVTFSWSGAGPGGKAIELAGLGVSSRFHQLAVWPWESGIHGWLLSEAVLGLVLHEPVL